MMTEGRKSVYILYHFMEWTSFVQKINKIKTDALMCQVQKKKSSQIGQKNYTS